MQEVLPAMDQPPVGREVVSYLQALEHLHSGHLI